MSLEAIVEDLKQISFLLSSRGFTRAYIFSSKAHLVLSKSPTVQSPSKDYVRVQEQLVTTINILRKCISTSSPGNPGSCVNEAKTVYKLSLLLNMVATGEIKRLVKARRAAYTSIALGLPTATLFGFPPFGVLLVFLGVLWTYFYFVRLKLIGWFTVASSLMVLIPFLFNAFSYFAHAVLSPEEVSVVARELGLQYTMALTVLIILLAISTTSLLLAVYALVVLLKYYGVFS